MSIKFSDVENWFKKFFKEATAVEVAASATVNSLAPDIEEILQAVDPAAASVVDPIANQVKTDLATAAVTLQAGQTGGVAGALTSVSANLSALLTAGHITDTASIAKATAINSVIQDLVAKF